MHVIENVPLNVLYAGKPRYRNVTTFCYRLTFHHHQLTFLQWPK